MSKDVLNALRVAMVIVATASVFVGLGRPAISQNATATTQLGTGDAESGIQSDNSATNRASAPSNGPSGTQVSPSSTQLTAEQAGNSKRDILLMAKIRKSLVRDPTLSIDAKNIKVIAQNGKITLTGPVATSAEKATVEKRAADVAGITNVTDNVSVLASH